MGLVMTRLSKHFVQSEFECKCGCGIEVIVSQSLINLLEEIRVSTGEPIRITSGARCIEHNRMVGGANMSWHIPKNHILYASDITYANSPKRSQLGILKLYILADQMNAMGLGLYDGRIHIDQRPSKRARWIDSGWKWLVPR